jgi:trk system potassium uptake protein TrkH
MSKINFKLIAHIVSLVILFESLFMLLALLVSILYHETTTLQLLQTFGFVFITGLLLKFLTHDQHNKEPNRKESFLIVSLSWIVMGIVGTLPYLSTHSFGSFTDAYFESISGFTTTGSSVLSDIESLPKSILFWRAETHWIGGMGIIVLVLAIMPFLKISGISLFYSEMSNVVHEQISTKIKYVARNLWLIYMGFTLLETLLLFLGKMPLFDSICHSFATVATGGFSTQNDSLAGYSPYIHYVVTLFMILSGINFVIHILVIKGQYKTAFKNEELHLFLAIIFVTGLLIMLSLYRQGNITLEKSFRDAFFQVASVITATGFATADYLLWPTNAIVLIAFLMLIGASAGSTGGGVKVIRHVIVLKQLKQSFQHLIHPNAISPLRYNRHLLKTGFVTQIVTFIFIYYFILLASGFVLMVTGLDAPTSFGAVATCMGGIGPGFGGVGPAANFGHLPVFVKYFLTFLMILGRLEIYSLIIIFTRSFWRP